jgi:anti-sigma factor RsiW
MSLHLTDDQLVDRLYGIASEGDAHLDSCPGCQSRWVRLLERRAEATAPVPLPAQYFHQQRRQIQNRLAAPVSGRAAVWVPTMAGLAVVAGLLLTRSVPTAPVSPPAVESAQVMEAGWFEDAYSATRIMEPRAASPIRELFAEGPVLE